MHVCVFQDSLRQGQGVVASGSDAETAGRLSATPHHQKRPAQVRHTQIKCMQMENVLF